MTLGKLYPEEVICSGYGFNSLPFANLKMLSPRFCLLQNKHPSSGFLPPLSLFNPKQTAYISHLIEHGAKKRITNLSSSSSWVVHAMEKDAEQFEVDPEKAKEALQNLDQQLQTLSKKQASTPKIRASEVKLAREKRVEADSPEAEISVSFLAYLTAGLFIFTIFYNVLFYTVIKPSIDGPESGPELSSDQSDQSGGAAVLQKLPLLFSAE